MKVGPLLKLQKLASKNAPAALAVLAGGAALGAVIFAIKGTMDAQEEIESLERDVKGVNYDEYRQAKKLKKAGKSDDDICKELRLVVPNSEKIITNTDVVNDTLAMPETMKKKKLKVYIKNYAPAAVLLGLSWFCLYGSCRESSKRIAALASAYMLSEKARKEYADKAEQLIGKKKVQDIRDEIIQDRITKNPASKASVANVDTVNQNNVVDLSLWYDIVSDRYFYSSAEHIRRAELEAQKMLDKNGFVSINDIYGILGIKEIPLGNDIGWSKEKRPDVSLVIGGGLDDLDRPIGTLDMDVYPSSSWLGEV